MTRVVSLALALSLLAPARAAFAADPGDEAAKQAKKKDELPSVSDALEDMEKIDGLLDVYRKKDDLRALVPNDKLGKPMLLATSVAGGSYFTGWQWTDMMVRFERHDKKILVIRPDTEHVAAKKGPISGAVERTHPGMVVGVLPVLGADPQKGVVISLSDLYVQQAQSFFGDLAKGRDPSLARLQSVKGFPENVEVTVDLIQPPRGSDHGDILTVHYSLSGLRKTSYVPRLADDRVGYFLTVSRDYTKDYRDETTFVRYVNRWNLQKADDDLELSPPEEPIIFYVEKTVPTRYRRWVHEGILEWNKAFEKVGFVDAIVVRQQTDSQFADIDPEDVRYNFFRWITSDTPFAMGPSRVDPRTGQILDADIIFDDSMLRSYMDDWDLFIEESFAEGRSPNEQRFIGEHPDWDPSRFLRRGGAGQTADATVGTIATPGARAEMLAALAARPGMERHEPPGSGRSLCSIGRGRARQLALGSIHLASLTAAQADDDSNGEDDSESDENGDEDENEKDEKKAKDRAWPEEFIGQVIKETVMHEVGHTLGLRHNFKASSWRPYAALNPADGEVQDLAASVMDYNPLNISAEPKRQGRYQMTTIGPYDFWAIEYGYTTTGARKPEAELKKLGEIAARSTEDGHDYATDEDLWIGDPLTNQWDFGQDTLDYAAERITLSRSLRDEVIERVVRDGESYSDARRAVDMLLFQVGYVADLASRHVGGTYFHRDHHGSEDAPDPVEVVPAEKQREALGLLSDHLFAADAFTVDPALLRKLAPSRWVHWGTWDTWGVEAAYPYHDRVLALQARSLYRCLSPSTLGRVLDTETLAGEGVDALTLPELMGTLTETIFAEIQGSPSGRFTNREPFLSGVRRNLQREYVSRLIDLALDEGSSWWPRAARTQAWYELRTLRDGIDSALGSGAQLDGYSQAHLEESKERISRALEASFQIDI